VTPSRQYCRTICGIRPSRVQLPRAPSALMRQYSWTCGNALALSAVGHVRLDQSSWRTSRGGVMDWANAVPLISSESTFKVCARRRLRQGVYASSSSFWSADVGAALSKYLMTAASDQSSSVSCCAKRS